MQGEKVLRNPCSGPRSMPPGTTSNAPSALIPEVGDRDNAEEDGTNFTPASSATPDAPLPEGERWGATLRRGRLSARSVPFRGRCRRGRVHARFRGPGRLKGLHRYYDRQVRQEAVRERITLSLRLAPHEIEALFAPGTECPTSARSSASTQGRASCGPSCTPSRLRPCESLTRCVFNRLAEDQ